jgi:hypothetical protein
VAGVTGDLIARHLARLRAGLPAPPERSGHILAAAAAAFGQVRVAVRARRRPASLALAEAGMAAMRLAASYLLAVSGAGLSVLVLREAVVHAVALPGTTVVSAGLGYSRTIGVLAAAAIAGLVLLGGYRAAERRRPRGARWPGGVSSGALPGGYFPLAAVLCMLVVVLLVMPLLAAVRFPGEPFASAPGVPSAAVSGAAAVATGHAVQTALILLRQRDTGERVPHAG